MIKRILVSITLTFLFLISTQNTQASHPQHPYGISAFREYIPIPELQINTPTVIEVPLPSIGLGQHNQAVLEIDTNTWQPSTIVNKIQHPPYQVTIDNNSYPELSDGHRQTYREFAPESEATRNQISILVSYDYPITTSHLMLQLPSNVQAPDSITVSTIDTQNPRIIVNNKTITTTNIQFPQTTAQTWEITLFYTQNLRISEISFVEKDPILLSSIRFLARPDNTYTVYLKPMDPQFLNQQETGNLASAVDVLTIPNTTPIPNPNFVSPDQDSDGISDTTDNCPRHSNPDQHDTNSNGTGDPCDDYDLDGIINAIDNCPDHANQLQQDNDGDGIGDHCDDEESRLTERLTWLPWSGIAVSFIIVFLLIRSTKNQTTTKQTTDNDPSQPNSSKSSPKPSKKLN